VSRHCRLPFRLKARQTCFETGQARLEFVRIDDPLRIAVDQAVDTAAQPDDVAIESLDIPGRIAAPRRSNASLMLFRDALRIIQDSLDLLPHSLLQLVAAH